MSETTTEENELDDWAAAMAEQEAAEQTQEEQTENQTTPDNEVTPDTDPASDTPDSNPGEALENVQNANATVFKEFSNESVLGDKQNDIDMILDIPVQLTVELGRTKIAIKNLLQLAQGSVVELDGLAGEPMDVLVNGCLIAQGEVVVVNDKFGIRLTDIITPSERIRKLNR